MTDFASDKEFRSAATEALKALLGQLDGIDDDEVDASLTEGSFTVTFESGGTFILSLQTPTHELWLSANLTAWHFVRRAGQWIERDTKEPMTDVLGRLFSEKLGTLVKLEL
jgi:iron donor protein CyaY